MCYNALMHRGYKTKLRTNNKQSSFLRQCAGASRFVWNWALRESMNRELEDGKSRPSAMYALKKEFNSLKKQPFVNEDGEIFDYSWIQNLPYTIIPETLKNLDTAYANYWRQMKDGTVKSRIADMKSRGKWDRHIKRRLKAGAKAWQVNPGYPQFKSRYDKAVFSLRGSSICVVDGFVRIPVSGAKNAAHKQIRVTPFFRVAEPDILPDGAKILYITISEEAGEWFVSFQCEVDDLPRIKPQVESIGIDVGVKSMAVISNGRVFDNPAVLRKSLGELKKLQQKLSRQEKGSNRREKTKKKIQHLHAKIARTRKHHQHEISSYVVKKVRPAIIGYEDLNISGMKRKAKPKQREDGTFERNNQAQKKGLNMSISDAGMGELLRQIEYKADWHGISAVKIDRWFASSKTCHNCGYIDKDQTLSDRTFSCPECGIEIDRDLNAAINIKNKAVETAQNL